MLLDESCVYTIATWERLVEASKDHTPLLESKRWITAKTLLRNARGSGRELPIIFADARDCSALMGWSVVQSISISASGTRYTIGPLWGVPPSTPQDLQLASSDAHIAPGHIRPYVLCKTPAFLLQEARQPRVWSPTAAARAQAREGKRRMTAHMRLERKTALVAALKKERMDRHDGRLPCEVCGFDFLECYGPVGAGFAEAHHKTSLAESPDDGRITTLDDLAIVCSNCHSMLHRAPEFPSIESIRKRVRRAKKQS